MNELNTLQGVDLSVPMKAPNPSFAQLVRPHLDGLYRLAYRLTRDRHNAEDLLQEVLVKLYPRRRKLAKIETLKPWLARVLYNHFIDQRRRYARDPLQLAISAPPDEPDYQPMDTMENSQAGPEIIAEWESELLHIQSALQRMTADHQLVVALHDVEGYTLEELEKILATPIGTLKSRLHRARARLREIIFNETI